MLYRGANLSQNLRKIHFLYSENNKRISKNVLYCEKNSQISKSTVKRFLLIALGATITIKVTTK